MRTMLAATVAFLAYPPVAIADSRVEIQVILQGTSSPTVPQEWNRALGEAGFDRATIRQPRTGDEMGITNTGTDDSPVYRVTAILSGNTLVLPPRSRFRRTDIRGIKRWISELKENGADSVTSPKTAFGLTPKQLATVNEDLKVMVTATTKGEKPADVVHRLTQNLNHPLVFDADAQNALRSDDALRDELNGLSIGTALATILRPAGLVLVPRATAGTVEMAIVDSRQQATNWPIGWQPQQSPGKTLPKLFESEKTQAIEVPLQAALDELSGRVGAPFLIDHNGMAAGRIDVQTPVTMRAGKRHYGAVLKHLLRQVGMQYEVRVDENNKPFLWISTGRR